MQAIQQRIDDNLLRKLAEFEATEMPVLSVYLDMRPQATGENPQIRSGEIVLKDRLNEIEKMYRPRGEDFDSFMADKAKIEEYLTHEFPTETQGLAIFACAAEDLWEVVEAGVNFKNDVIVGETPDLYQFAKLLDKHEKTVVAVVDTNTTRFFVTDYGFLEEVDSPNDKNAKMFRKTQLGGWKQTKYQRNIDNNREDFVKEAVKELEDLIKREEASKLILAGDQVAIPLYQNALSQEAKQILSDNVMSIDIKAPKSKIIEEVQGIIADYEYSQSHKNADKLIGEHKRNCLGVVGAKATKVALENGQVDTLLLDSSADSVTEEIRNEFIKLAATTSADVEMVADHAKFNQLGGVGAILRYRI